MAEHPVDHIAAEGAAGHAELRTTHPGISGERRVEAAHEVAIDLTPPVLAHGVDEPLAVPERTARVDDDEAKTFGREHLVVPAAVPLVEPRALRSAMNEQDRRILLRGVEVGRLHDEALHAHAARREPEVLGGIHVELA